MNKKVVKFSLIAIVLCMVLSMFVSFVSIFFQMA